MADGTEHGGTKQSGTKHGGTERDGMEPGGTKPGGTEKSEEDWERELPPEKYRILRQGGTERAFTGTYWDYDEHGTYRCGACGAVLFESDAKYTSGSGWPSFFKPAENDAVETREDHSLGMVRTEVLCATCGSHLGHVFDDGPDPTGQRFCINSAALEFDDWGGTDDED